MSLYVLVTQVVQPMNKKSSNARERMQRVYSLIACLCGPFCIPHRLYIYSPITEIWAKKRCIQKGRNLRKIFRKLLSKFEINVMIVPDSILIKLVDLLKHAAYKFLHTCGCVFSLFGVVCGFVREVSLECAVCSLCHVVFQFYKTFSYFLRGIVMMG